MPKELTEGRKIKLYEMKTECSDDEDQLFMLDGEEILGPFCHLQSTGVTGRYKRGTTLEASQYEVDSRAG